MTPLAFLLSVLVYAIYLIIASIYTNKRLQNHRVHSITFPDEEFNVLFRKAKLDGEKFYKLLRIFGFLIVFLCFVNLIKSIISTNYEIEMFVYIVAGIIVVLQIILISISDGDGFWLYGAATDIDRVIRHYELQNFKKQSQWQEITGEYPMDTNKYYINKYIGRFAYNFFLTVRVIFVINLFCFSVSMLINLFY